MCATTPSKNAFGKSLNINGSEMLLATACSCSFHFVNGGSDWGIRFFSQDMSIFLLVGVYVQNKTEENSYERFLL